MKPKQTKPNLEARRSPVFNATDSRLRDLNACLSESFNDFRLAHAAAGERLNKQCWIVHDPEYIRGRINFNSRPHDSWPIQAALSKIAV